MDKELLVENILRRCNECGIKTTIACHAAGVGKSFVSNIKAGQTPSVAKVADLAAFLGVSTSDLVGDVRALPAPLLAAWDALNDEGREKLIDYADDLVAGGRYIKKHPADLGQADAG